jgi:hypothetical protein
VLTALLMPPLLLLGVSALPCALRLRRLRLLVLLLVSLLLLLQLPAAAATTWGALAAIDERSSAASIMGK